jgi:hypothetical protein
MIELQNGRYVRVNSTAANGDALPLASSPALEATPSGTHSTRPSSTPPLIATSSEHFPPPAVLIFRDGHREEVRDYTIADGFLYARGDYYTDGYWNKKDRSLHSQPEPNPASQRRSQRQLRPPFSPERSHHPSLSDSGTDDEIYDAKQLMVCEMPGGDVEERRFSAASRSQMTARFSPCDGASAKAPVPPFVIPSPVLWRGICFPLLGGAALPALRSEIPCDNKSSQ